MPTTKLIPGFAKSMANKFMISCEHIAYMMEENKIEEFKADLIDATISQPELDVERNRILIGYVSNNLKNLMDKYPNIKMAKAD